MKREASSRRVAAVVQRAYAPQEEACAQAVETLLKKSLPSKEGGLAIAAPDDTKESENIGTATDKYSGEPAAGSPGRPRRHSRKTQATPSVGELEVRLGRQEVDEASL